MLTGSKFHVHCTIEVALSFCDAGHRFCKNNFAQVEAIQAKLRFAKKMQNMDKFYVSLGNGDNDAHNYVYIV